MAKLVPSSSKGSGRRAYQYGYQRSDTARVDNLLGKRKLNTSAVKAPKAPKGPLGVSKSKGAKKSTPSISSSADFGDTGFNDPLFKTPRTRK
jgi:hypothetical protein